VTFRARADDDTVRVADDAFAAWGSRELAKRLRDDRSFAHGGHSLSAARVGWGGPVDRAPSYVRKESIAE